jgi:septation ring formation regulator EzrA
LGIAVDIDGNILLGDRNNKVILKYDLTKNTLEKLPINDEIEPRD